MDIKLFGLIYEGVSYLVAHVKDKPLCVFECRQNGSVDLWTEGFPVKTGNLIAALLSDGKPIEAGNIIFDDKYANEGGSTSMIGTREELKDELPEYLLPAVDVLCLIFDFK